MSANAELGLVPGHSTILDALVNFVQTICASSLGQNYLLCRYDKSAKELQFALSLVDASVDWLRQQADDLVEIIQCAPSIAQIELLDLGNAPDWWGDWIEDIPTLGLPETTYNEFMAYAEMKEKHDYVMDISSKNTTKENTATHIAVFSAFTEGMQLFSSFIMLLNFPRHGKMKGMGQIVTWSIVDETQHTENMVKLFRTYIQENNEIWNDELKGRLYTIAERMVELEDKFIDLAFKMGAMEDLSAEDVKKYIRYIADRRLISLGLKGVFKVKRNPLPWVEEMINAPTHTNFFENRATDYAKGALSGDWSDVWAN
jgi:hypothetical protein